MSNEGGEKLLRKTSKSPEIRETASSESGQIRNRGCPDSLPTLQSGIVIVTA